MVDVNRFARAIARLKGKGLFFYFYFITQV